MRIEDGTAQCRAHALKKRRDTGRPAKDFVRCHVGGHTRKHLRSRIIVGDRYDLFLAFLFLAGKVESFTKLHEPLASGTVLASGARVAGLQSLRKGCHLVLAVHDRRRPACASI